MKLLVKVKKYKTMPSEKICYSVEKIQKIKSKSFKN